MSIRTSKVPPVGIVVPTLGTRRGLLQGCLESIRNAGNAYVVLVGPKGLNFDSLVGSGLIDRVIEEPEANLAAAIDLGLRSMPEGVQYVNWLGDDDELLPGAINWARSRMSEPDQPVLVYGGCEYIDIEGRLLLINKSGPWANKILRFGPQLIPQPGALFRLDAYKQIGGLNQSLSWAFDYDLLIRLKLIGKLAYVSKILARFRWHDASLSVKGRRDSVSEASLVRVMLLPRWAKGISELWEWPLRTATFYAGNLLSLKREADTL